jgi:hypothetical protein
VAGFGVAGGATFYQLHKDITAGTQYLAEQVSVAPGHALSLQQLHVVLNVQ